jgi:hypothetical protein
MSHFNRPRKKRGTANPDSVSLLLNGSIGTERAHWRSGLSRPGSSFARRAGAHQQNFCSMPQTGRGAPLTSLTIQISKTAPMNPAIR